MCFRGSGLSIVRSAARRKTAMSDELERRATTRELKRQKPMVTYWVWLCRGSGGGAGLRPILGRWFPIHIGIGSLLAVLVPKPLDAVASTILLPLAGVLIGLAFAWAGNAQALL